MCTFSTVASCKYTQFVPVAIATKLQLMYINSVKICQDGKVNNQYLAIKVQKFLTVAL